MEYSTRRTKHGAALQICKIASNRYVRVVLERDPSVVVVSFNRAPFEGSLTELYQRFERAMAGPLPETREDFVGDKLAVLEAVRGLLVSKSLRAYPKEAMGIPSAEA